MKNKKIVRTFRKDLALCTAAAMLLVSWGLLQKVQASGNPDTMTVSVTPNVTYAVTITSVNSSGYSFGTVNLGATTVSTSAIVIANSGNVSEYFSMAVSNTSGGWNVTASAPAQDQFRMIAEIAASQPAPASFVVGDALAVPPVPSTAATLYGQASTKTAPAGTKNLWLRLEMPTSLNTGTSGAQTMTLSVNGQGT